MTSWQPGRGQVGVTNRPGIGSGGAVRNTPGRYNEDMEQLIFRMHQMLIEELDADQISAMPSTNAGRLWNRQDSAALRDAKRRRDHPRPDRLARGG